MTALTAALAVALVIAVVVLVRLRRDRARTLEALGVEEGDVPEMVTRLVRESAPRADLSEARAWRDAVAAAVPNPVIVFDGDGRLLRANGVDRSVV